MFVRVQEATSRSDREEIYRFRYRVYVDELRKPLPYADHERRLFTDEMDEQSRILVAFDESAGTIVGTVRTLFGGTQPFPDSLVDKLQLGPMIDAVGMEHLTHSGMFMVDPAYRGLTIASQLVAHMYRAGFERDAHVDVCVAEMALVRPYYQMGYRPYSAPIRPFAEAGLRIPLAWVLRDRDYLASVGSPFAAFIPPDQVDQGKTAARIRTQYPDFRDPKVSPRKLREFWSAVAHSSPAFKPPSLFEGVPPERAEQLLGDLPTISLEAGQQLYRRGERERGMGLVLGGKLGVALEEGAEPFYFSVLMPGELCGEMANFLPHGRSASLVALEETEVLLLPHNFVEKLERKDPELGVALRRNVAALLASRLDAMNHRVVGLSRGNPERIRPRPEPIGTNTMSFRPLDSYSISTLENSEAELERLEKQAAMGEELEAVWFKRVGFRDGSTILDLGSGPGITTCLLARVFPGARVLGVEPDARLREVASQRARDLGYNERCTFLEGSGEALPLADDSVDFVYARFLFQHLSRPSRVTAEAARVVRSGGVISVMDVDDGGVVIHPEPPGFRDFQARVLQSQSLMGGDRTVGRKLLGLLEGAGFQEARTEVVPLSSHVIPARDLLDIAFGFKSQTLKRAGHWEDGDEGLLRRLWELSDQPGSWIYIPVFLSHARAS